MRLYPSEGPALGVPGEFSVACRTRRVRKDVTYSKDVAPILFKSCAVCHHPNDIAPMSLMTYKEVRPWRRQSARK